MHSPVTPPIVVIPSLVMALTALADKGAIGFMVYKFLGAWYTNAKHGIQHFSMMVYRSRIVYHVEVRFMDIHCTSSHLQIKEKP